VAASALLATSFASAAGLSLSGGSISVVASTHPCPETATATAVTGSGTTYSAVSITVPNGCGGRALSLTLLNGTTVLRSGTATVAASGATTVTFTGTYTASSSLTVRAAVGGWDLPTTWAFTPPALPALSCAPVDPSVTATCTLVIDRWNFWGNGYRLDFRVTTASTTAFEWEVRLDLARTDYPAPGGGTLFPGDPVPSPWPSQPAWTPDHFGSPSNVCSTSGVADLPVLTLRGSEAWNYQVSSTKPAKDMGIQVVAFGGNPITSYACP